MQHSRGLLMGVRLAGSPPTGSVLNGPGRRNLALRNGGQFSWSTRRRGAKAVCESPCSLLLLRGGFTPFPLLWSAGEVGLLSSPNTGPAPSVPMLCVGGHG